MDLCGLRVVFAKGYEQSLCSEIVKEKTNKRVSAKSIAARQVRQLSKTWATFVPARLFTFARGFPG